MPQKGTSSNGLLRSLPGPASSKSSPRKAPLSTIWILILNSALAMISPTTSFSCCGRSAYSDQVRPVNRAGSTFGGSPAVKLPLLGQAVARLAAFGPIGDGIDSVGAASRADGELLVLQEGLEVFTGGCVGVGLLVL